MPLNYHKGKLISLSEAGLDERWLQQRIDEDPSLLGLGDVDSMSWGLMIGMSRALLRTAWWMSVFPGIALFVTVLALTLISDGLGRSLGGRRQSML